MLRRKSDVPCPALLDLRDIKLEQVIKPCDQFLPVRTWLLALVHEGEASARNLAASWGLSYLDSPILDMWMCGVGRIAYEMENVRYPGK